MSERKLTILELHFHSHGDVEVGTGGSSGLRDRLRRPKLTDRLRRRTRESEPATERGNGLSIPIPTIAAIGGVALAAATWRALRDR